MLLAVLSLSTCLYVVLGRIALPTDLTVQDYVSKLAVLLVSAKGDPDSEAGAEVQVVLQPMQSVLLCQLDLIYLDACGIKHCMQMCIFAPAMSCKAARVDMYAKG